MVHCSRARAAIVRRIFQPSRRVAVQALLVLLLAWPALADDEGSAQQADQASSETSSEQSEASDAPLIDLTARYPGHPDTWLRPNLRFDTVWFTGWNAWAGNSEGNIGKDNMHGWAEFGLVPGLDGQLSLGDYGRLTARISAVYTTTQIGLDFAGSNLRNNRRKTPQEITLEDAYVRWSSGGLFPGLGEDAVELSVGSQNYQIGPEQGPGFLFYNAGSDGGKRGGYWLGLRNAFQLAAIASLKTGNFHGDVVYLRTDELSGNHSKIVGGNLDYNFGSLVGLENLTFGVGYWNIYDSYDPRRDGLNVIDMWMQTNPLPEALPGLGITVEFVKEKNSSRNDSLGGWGEIGYDFGAHDAPGSPYISFRQTYFSGNNQSSGNDNAFDPLYYGFSDWEYWYLGEIAGEWITGNSNFLASIARFRVSPHDSVTAQLYYLYLRLDERQPEVEPPGGRPVDPRVVAITDKDLAHELDFIVDWSVTDYFSMSATAAVLFPLRGGKQFFGDNEPWTQFMLYTSLQF